MQWKGLIDTHVHLDFGHFDGERDQIIERARIGGVEKVINIGSNLKSSQETVKLVRNYPDYIRGAVGIHPHNARDLNGDLLRKIKELAKGEEIVALGEMGLDFHYDNSPRDDQKRAFRAQLRLARDLGKPAVIHSRSAEGDTVTILREEGIQEIGGVMHCFSGNRITAEKTLEMGLYLAFGGVITFPKADELRAIAASTPLERLLIETDCPYLTPVPYRGKRNEPLYVGYVAEKLAEIREESLEEIIAATANNARKLFNL